MLIVGVSADPANHVAWLTKGDLPVINAGKQKKF
jgi:hypothetical protein